MNNIEMETPKANGVSKSGGGGGKAGRNTVSSKQLIALTLIIGLGMNLLNLPALAVMDAGRDGWIVMLIIAAADCLGLYCTLIIMQKLRSSQTKGKAGIVLKTVFNAVFFLWAFAKLVLLLGEARLFFGKIVFENVDWLILMALMCALTAVLGGGGGRGIGRLAELMLPLTVVTVAVLLITSYAGDVHLSDVLPAMYNNSSALKTPLKLYMWASNYPVLFCLFKDAEFKKRTKLYCVTAAAASGLVAAALSLVLSASYGHITYLIEYGSNASNMTQFIGSYNFGRIDLIVYTLWSVALIAEAGLFHHACSRSLTGIFRKERAGVYALSVAAAAYCLLNFLLPTSTLLYEYAAVYLPLPAVVLGFALPVTAALVSLFVKKKTDAGGALYDRK